MSLSAPSASPVRLSDGEFTFEVVPDWARLPAEVFLGDVAAVGVDPQDNVYLFTRGDHPMIVLDREGSVLRTWGHQLFTRPHGLHIAHDGALYLTDDGDHTVRKMSPTGELLLEIGNRNRPTPLMSGQPFHRCTHTALSPSGDIYVSDGYGNARIHKYDPSGRLLFSWGQSGTGAGEFYIPHNLVCDDQGLVYVADRENHRIQIFNDEGRYEGQWNNVHRPCALCRAAGSGGNFYVGEAGPALASALAFPNLGPRVSILSPEGQVLARLTTGEAGITPGSFIAPHGIAVDSRGDIYVAEVSYRGWSQAFPERERPERVPSLTKLRRVKGPCASKASAGDSIGQAN